MNKYFTVGDIERIEIFIIKKVKTYLAVLENQEEAIADLDLHRPTAFYL